MMVNDKADGYSQKPHAFTAAGYKGDILAAGRDNYKDKNKDNDKGHGYSKKPDAFTSAGFKR